MYLVEILNIKIFIQAMKNSNNLPFIPNILIQRKLDNLYTLKKSDQNLILFNKTQKNLPKHLLNVTTNSKKSITKSEQAKPSLNMYHISTLIN